MLVIVLAVVWMLFVVLEFVVLLESVVVLVARYVFVVLAISCTAFVSGLCVIYSQALLSTSSPLAHPRLSGSIGSFFGPGVRESIWGILFSCTTAVNISNDDVMSLLTAADSLLTAVDSC